MYSGRGRGNYRSRSGLPTYGHSGGHTRGRGRSRTERWTSFSQSHGRGRGLGGAYSSQEWTTSQECRFYARGRCYYGSSCSFLHVERRQFSRTASTRKAGPPRRDSSPVKVHLLDPLATKRKKKKKNKRKRKGSSPSPIRGVSDSESAPSSSTKTRPSARKQHNWDKNQERALKIPVIQRHWVPISQTHLEVIDAKRSRSARPSKRRKVPLSPSYESSSNTTPRRRGSLYDDLGNSSEHGREVYDVESSSDDDVMVLSDTRSQSGEESDAPKAPSGKEPNPRSVCDSGDEVVTLSSDDEVESKSTSTGRNQSRSTQGTQHRAKEVRSNGACESNEDSGYASDSSSDSVDSDSSESAQKSPKSQQRNDSKKTSKNEVITLSSDDEIEVVTPKSKSKSSSSRKKSKRKRSEQEESTSTVALLDSPASKSESSGASASDAPTFSVLTYNVLSDAYVTRDQYPTYEYPWWLLEANFRRANIVRELADANADIVTLQEVSGFAEWIEALQDLGYSVVYKQKTGEKEDGVFVGFKADKFEYVESKVVEYRKYPKGVAKDQIGLIVKLREKSSSNSSARLLPSEGLCVATTHIIFNPKRGEIKTSQVQMLLAALSEMAGDGPVILSGDFNSMVDSIISHYIRSGELEYPGYSRRQLGGTHQHKEKSMVHQIGMDEILTNKNMPPTSLEPFQNETDTYLVQPDTFARLNKRDTDSKIHHDLNLMNAFEREYDDGELRVTGYREEFRGKVDHMWFTPDHFDLVANLELPRQRELMEHGQLPNVRISSDHLFIASRFRLRS